MSVISVKERAKRMLISPTLKTVSSLAGSNLLATALAVIGSLVQARFVLPSELGYFNSFSIATGYAFFLQLGLIDTVYRYYPYFIGKGQQDKATAVAQLAQTWTGGVAALVAGAFCLLAISASIRGEWRATFAWLVQAIVISSILYGGYLGATYRSGHDFATVSRSLVISSAINLLVLPLFAVWSYIALALRGGLAGLVNLIYLHHNRPLKLNWPFQWREWLELVRTGLPLFIAGYGATTMWTVTETALVLQNLGTAALGLWAMSVMLREVAIKIPQALTTVYKPRLTELYGRTESVAECMRLIRKPLMLGTPVVAAVGLGLAVVLALLVPLLMPNYSAATPVMGLMMLMLPLSVLDLPATLIIAMGKMTQQNVSVFAGLVSFVILAQVFGQLGWGLAGMAVATLMGRGISLVLVYWFIRQAYRREQTMVV